MMRFSVGLAGLLVGTAMSLLAPSARAEFTMELKDTSGAGFTITENAAGTGYTLVTSGGVTDVTVVSASADKLEVKSTIKGYAFDLTAMSNRTESTTPTQGMVTVGGTVTAKQ